MTNKKWNRDSLITSAIRKIWGRSPMKAMALKQALVNPDAKRYDQRYECSHCGKEFLAAQVEVHHVDEGKANETWDQWIERIFLGISNVSYIDKVPLANSSMLPAFDEIVCESLVVMCKPCHAKCTKEAKARNKVAKKEGKYDKSC